MPCFIRIHFFYVLEIFSRDWIFWGHFLFFGVISLVYEIGFRDVRGNFDQVGVNFRENLNMFFMIEVG